MRAIDLWEVLESSIFKAIRQGNSARRALQRKDPTRADLVSFIIIVTFKEMFLGPIEDFCKTSAELHYTKLQQEYSDLVNVHNIFLMDILAFERLIQNCKNRGIRVGEFLEKVAMRNANAGQFGRRFVFRMHLDEEEFFDGPPFVADEFKGLNAEVRGIFDRSPIAGFA